MAVYLLFQCHGTNQMTEQMLEYLNLLSFDYDDSADVENDITPSTIDRLNVNITFDLNDDATVIIIGETIEHIQSYIYEVNTRMRRSCS